MTTMFKPAIEKILRLFYENKNQALHLREISRRAKMNESSISRHLNNLVKNKILFKEKDANLRKFSIYKDKIPEIFPFFDSERLECLPLLRRDAIRLYIQKIEKKPALLIVFGSTAKRNFRKDSDLDILEITSAKNNNKLKDYIDSQTGIKLQIFKVSENNFKKELVSKKDKVIQSALETGFPVFNAKYFYEVIYNGE